MAVAEWAGSRSFRQVTTRHRDVLAATRDGFAKYRRRLDPVRIEKVFAALPRLVGRKFQPTQVDRDERSQALKDAFRMLAMARVVTPVRRTDANPVTLGAEVDERYENNSPNSTSASSFGRATRSTRNQRGSRGCARPRTPTPKSTTCWRSVVGWCRSK